MNNLDKQYQALLKDILSYGVEKNDRTELGPIYGRQWRNWNAIFDGGVDQIQNLINNLKTNPDSRRLMVNAWNVGELDQMTLPPCHYGFQVYTRELSNEEKYNIWFNKNYETGMEKYFDPNNLPDFDNEYYAPIPKRAISSTFGGCVSRFAV